jgi:hypothetical protein
VIESLLSIVKAIDADGSTQLILAGALPAVFLAVVWPRKWSWVRRWCWLVGPVYLLLTLPIVAHALAASLADRGDGYREPDGPVSTLVIFDGDNRRGRLRAARATIEASPPSEVWVLGVQPEWFQEEMPGEGIGLDRVRFDATTGTTRAQLAWVAEYQSAHPSAAVAVVVSRMQAARVAGIAAARGMSRLPIIGAEASREPATSGVWQLVPSRDAWNVSRDAIYEHLALAYYERSGWIVR